MKKLLLCLTVGFGIFTFGLATTPAQAAITNSMIDALEPVALPQTDEPGGEEVLLGRIIQFFLSVFGIIFLALMIYGGYTYMKAQGREEEVDRGKKIIQSAVIGIIIAFLAYSITFFVLSRLPGAGGVGDTPSAESEE